MDILSLLLCLSLVILQCVVAVKFTDNIIVPEEEDDCCNGTFDPHSPLIKCRYLPEEFIKCSSPEDRQGNITAKKEYGHGCAKWGGQRFEDVEMTRLKCKVLPNIECHGEREFLSLKEYPCIKYTGHYFVTTLIYSVLLGFLGMDRFCLGHTGTAVGKLLTLGGVGIWWIVDVILLVTGELRPRDDSNWVPYY